MGRVSGFPEITEHEVHMHLLFAALMNIFLIILE